MKIYLVSGDGFGAGKSTFAKTLADEVWSIAGALREDLKRQYPTYDWFNKSQKYKDTTIVDEYGRGSQTVREVLVEYRQAKAAIEPTIWVSKMADRLEYSAKQVTGSRIFAVDDLRKVCELEHLRARFGRLVTHFHMATETATQEPEFDGPQLRERADYLVKWTPTK